MINLDNCVHKLYIDIYKEDSGVSLHLMPCDALFLYYYLSNEPISISYHIGRNNGVKR